jgi:hypothetical protein
MIALVLLLLGQETSMKFVKLEVKGTNPLIATEKTLYKESCIQSLEQTFKGAPVYMVYYKENKEEKIVPVGNVSCVFRGGDDKWMTAVVKLNKEVPKGYVLRAKFVATEADYNLDRVLVVKKCTITEFYLKPEDKATKFD